MIAAQLPKEITETEVEQLLEDDGWAISQKLDGQRIMLSLEDGRPFAFGRNGVPKAPQPPTLRKAQLPLAADGFTLDGELMPDGVFYAFDLLGIGGKYCTDTKLSQRLLILAGLVKKIDNSVIRLVNHYASPITKRDLWNEAQELSLEGVVFKKLDAPYESGKNRNFLKHKFIKDVDVHVIDAQVDGKDNFLLAVYDENGKEVEVGKVSALTGDGNRIKIGDVVTVQCLYVSDGNRLVQPVAPKLRDDKTPNECSIDQLTQLKTRKDIIL